MVNSSVPVKLKLFDSGTVSMIFLKGGLSFKNRNKYNMYIFICT